MLSAPGAGLAVAADAASAPAKGASAAPAMKAGLWEHKVQMSSRSGTAEAAMAAMRQQLEQMPPAQRRQFEAAMAGQGLQMGSNVNTFQVCVTPEEAARQDLPPPDEGCTQEVVERGSNRLKVTFVCQGEGGKPTTGEGEATFESDMAYVGRAVIEGEVNGQPDRILLNQRARWVSSDCGPVKPRPKPKRP